MIFFCSIACITDWEDYVYKGPWIIPNHPNEKISNVLETHLFVYVICSCDGLP